MRRAYCYHCGQLFACMAVAFLLAAHEKLCTLPPVRVEARTQRDAPPTQSHKPRRKPPALTDRTPDCLLPRRSPDEVRPLRHGTWTQRQSDGSADRPTPPIDAGQAGWRMLARVRGAGRRLLPPPPWRIADRGLQLLRTRLISRHGPPAA